MPHRSRLEIHQTRRNYRFTAEPTYTHAHYKMRYGKIRTKGIENGPTRSSSLRQVTRHTDGESVFAWRQTRQISSDFHRLIHIWLCDRQLAQHIVARVAHQDTNGLARCSGRHGQKFFLVVVCRLENKNNY